MIGHLARGGADIAARWLGQKLIACWRIELGVLCDPGCARSDHGQARSLAYGSDGETAGGSRCKGWSGGRKYRELLSFLGPRRNAA